ncbi:MAG: hypothetical protein HFG28_14125 [Eubacterium sp.]|nr:hypothetical protein [uncultured Schaedlerella sp.]MCI9128275.1 hypothetical protein [Eubacterium sp.]
MKKKIIGSMLAVLLLVVTMKASVRADYSDLDVSNGDRCSFYTYKLNDGDPCYYVTTTTYVGYPIVAQSVSIDGIGSVFTQLERGTGVKYSYGCGDIPYGKKCMLRTGPTNWSGDNWHVIGRYNP